MINNVFLWFILINVNLAFSVTNEADPYDLHNLNPQEPPHKVFKDLRFNHWLCGEPPHEFSVLTTQNKTYALPSPWTKTGDPVKKLVRDLTDAGLSVTDPKIDKDPSDRVAWNDNGTIKSMTLIPD